MAAIQFFQEDILFKLNHPRKTTHWIKRVVALEGYTINQINFVFCSDSYLFSLNKQFLNHSTLTDIITFDHSDEKGVLLGDIFISVERIQDNASKYKIEFDNEIHRVIVHGVLHLMGYKDKSRRDKVIMRKKEDACLSLPR